MECSFLRKYNTQKVPGFRDYINENKMLDRALAAWHGMQARNVDTDAGV